MRIAEGVSIWPQVVMRAESAHISIGAYTNVQDFTMIHVGSGPSVIGEYCSLTHHCTIHGARIGDNCLIGINATVMDEAVLGNNCIVAGHTIITEGSVFEDDSVIAGVPGRLITHRDNYAANKINALAYHENALAYAQGHHRRWSDPDYAELVEQWREALGQAL